jgi:hypothetical protein
LESAHSEKRICSLLAGRTFFGLVVERVFVGFVLSFAHLQEDMQAAFVPLLVALGNLGEQFSV